MLPKRWKQLLYHVDEGSSLTRILADGFTREEVEQHFPKLLETPRGVAERNLEDLAGEWKKALDIAEDLESELRTAKERVKGIRKELDFTAASLVDSGLLTPTEASKAAGIDRSHLYNVLKRLKEEG